MSDAEEIDHRGVRWRRVRGRVGWFDEDQGKWVMWGRGRDAPPLPPAWAHDAAGGPLSRSRPRWLSGYRLAPIVLAVAAVTFAVVQAVRPSGNAVKAEAAASAKLLGQCLAQNGSADGHPHYAATPVACNSPTASVQVVAVVATSPGSTQVCPASTTGFQIPYVGVEYPHILCVRSRQRGG